MSTRRNCERLVVRLLCELRGVHIGNPDLNGPKPLFAKSLTVSADTNGGGDEDRRRAMQHMSHVTMATGRRFSGWPRDSVALQWGRTRVPPIGTSETEKKRPPE